jgi:hypothetical protein
MKTRIAFIDKLLNIKYNFSPILHNRFILYFFTLIALINVVFLAGVGDVPSLITFVLVGFLTSFFSKNMIVILVLSLTVTHILKYGMGNTYEGMKSADATTDETEEKADETEEKDKTTDKKKKPTKEEMMKEYEKFKEVQPDIVDGITKIDPLLKKAENFIEKYENYKGISGFSNAMKTDEGKQKIKEALESMRK